MPWIQRIVLQMAHLSDRCMQSPTERAVADPAETNSSQGEGSESPFLRCEVSQPINADPGSQRDSGCWVKQQQTHRQTRRDTSFGPHSQLFCCCESRKRWKHCSSRATAGRALSSLRDPKTFLRLGLGLHVCMFESLSPFLVVRLSFPTYEAQLNSLADGRFCSLLVRSHVVRMSRLSPPVAPNRSGGLVRPKRESKESCVSRGAGLNEGFARPEPAQRSTLGSLL